MIIKLIRKKNEKYRKNNLKHIIKFNIKINENKIFNEINIDYFPSIIMNILNNHDCHAYYYKIIIIKK